MERYYWLNKDSRVFLQRGYLEAGMTPEMRVRQIAETAEKILGIEGFADKFEDYTARGFYSLATPVWMNFGNNRGLPVSCFGSYIGDTMEDILNKTSEVGIMSKKGGGTSAYFGDLRPRGAKISVGGESGGPNQFLELVDVASKNGIKEYLFDGGSLVHIYEMFDVLANTVSQGSARRGSFAAYLPVEHPDIEEFLQIRDEGHRIQNMSIGVTIGNEWMKSMIKGDKKKREIFAAIVKKRFATGYPYIMFSDTVNNNAPDVYKDKGMKIKASNLCSEICLSADEKNSFVCVLSSLNLLHWEEIKETDAIETLIYFLDAVNEEFITKTSGMEGMGAAHNFAKTQRALGAGVLGWHSFLQSKSIAFESFEAKMLNNQIWAVIKDRSDKASVELAGLFGEPELLKGYGRRNVTKLAVAPTTSSSFILGQISPSVEPLNSNYFVNKLAKGVFVYQNPFLVELLNQKGKNTEETWKSILLKGGSVQHLDFLSQHEKDVFKTFGEISQKEIIIQAAQRQTKIDQSQSLNLMIPPQTPAQDVIKLIVEFWKLDGKTLYYQHSANPSQNLARNILACASCEG
jgi:ribonucleoside-diphosphate reductase alpha chain